MKKKRAVANKGRSSGAGVPLDPELLSLMRLVDAKRHTDVEQAARRILGQRVNHPLALKALSFALIGQGRYEEALPLLEFAVSLYGQDPELQNNFGIALHFQMRWEDAVKAFKRGLELAPKDFEIWKNLGVAYSGMRRWNEAVPPLLKAIELHPGDYVDAVTVLASVLLNGNRIDEALVCYGELCAHDPEDRGLLYNLISASMRNCCWDGLEDKFQRLRRLSADFTLSVGSAFTAFAIPGVSGREHRQIADIATLTAIPNNILNGPSLVPAATEHRGVHARRLRIGYLSADYRQHAVGFVLPEVIERHDRTRFEIFAYSVAEDDHSAIRQRLVAAFDHFCDAADLSVRDTAAKIVDDGIDILVDLTGWTANGRPEVLAMRCAPVQVNWLGYPGTLGHARLADYLIGDPIVTPLEHTEWYSETLALLPNCYLPADATRPVMAAPTRREAGLPESGFVFCSFNNSYKYNPELWDLWCGILRQIPGSVLWLSSPGSTAQGHLRREAEARGVAAERVIFAPRTETQNEHLARIQLADLALDTFPYNSHSTGIDTLWAGVPMVALLGGSFAGRVGASLLSAAGLGDLVTHTPDEYLRLAVALASTPERLALVRSRLWESRGSVSLFNMERFTRGLEGAFLRMWANHEDGRSEPILVS